MVIEKKNIRIKIYLIFVLITMLILLLTLSIVAARSEDIASLLGYQQNKSEIDTIVVYDVNGNIISQTIFSENVTVALSYKDTIIIWISVAAIVAIFTACLLFAFIWHSEGSLKKDLVQHAPMPPIPESIETDNSITDKENLKKELLEAKDATERANKAKSDFMSRMSHELRTPLNAITGMTYVAKKANNIEKKDFCLDKIENASKHLLGIINDILDMSKIESNTFELHFVEFSIEKMLAKIIKGVSFLADEKNLELRTNISQEVPSFIKGDEVHISQVITNLLTNAIKFTDNNGIVSLSMEKVSEADNTSILKIIIEDNGIGISEEQQANLFKSFEQADGGIARKYGGTGLGLAISKRIIEMMGGQIWVESILGKGSKFMFTMKATNGTEQQSTGRVNTADAATGLKSGNESAANASLPFDFSVLLPVLDVQTGLRRLNNNRKIYKSVLSKFSATKMASDIVDKIQAGDDNGIAQAAHALKGVGANLGFDTIADVCVKIEASVKAGDADLNQWIDVLNKEADEAMNAINTLLQSGALNA